MKLNIRSESEPVVTHGGGPAQRINATQELRRTLLTCLLWEDTYYESGSDIAKRIAALVPQVTPRDAVDLAIEARTKHQLRHAPLFVLRELARCKGAGPWVKAGLEACIQRADELAEYLAIYWKDDKPNARQSISAASKKGLAAAFTKFGAYALGKYNQDSAIKLRDVLFLCHAKPKDAAQAKLWKQLIDGTLPIPDTWEVALSAGKDKKETFERLMEEGKLGGLALLRNLRKMQEVGVSLDKIKARLTQGAERALPFRFLAAAKYAPKLEPEIEQAMFLSLAQVPKLKGRTLLVVDTSGSMGARLSEKSDMNRLDAAAAVAVMIREICEEPTVYITAGDDHKRKHATMEIPGRRGFALVDAIKHSQKHVGGGGIFLVQCMDYIASKEPKPFDRVIVFTDEQDCDTGGKAPENAKKLAPKNYVVNVGTYKNGISYRGGWDHIDGWSERIADYIQVVENAQTQTQS